MKLTASQFGTRNNGLVRGWFWNGKGENIDTKKASFLMELAFKMLIPQRNDYVDVFY